MKRVRATIPLAVLALSVPGCHLAANSGSKEPPASRPSAPVLMTDDFPEPAVSDPVQRKIGLLHAKAALSEADANYQEAIQDYEQILEVAPEDVLALHRLAILHTQTGSNTRAERYFQRALQLADDNARLHNDFGYYCHLRQRPDDAIRHLRRAVALAPGMLEAHNNLGLVYARLGQYAEAENHFQLAGCTRAETLNNVAFGRLMEHDHDEAAAIYQRALEADPHQANARNALSQLNQNAAGAAARR